MRPLVEYYVYGNLHISIASAVYFMGGFAVAGIPINLSLTAIVFFGALLTYNGHRLIGLARMNQVEMPERFRFTIRHYQSLLVITGISAVVCLVLAVISMSLVFLFFVPPALITALYLLPLLPGRRRLRDVAWIKLFLIAAVWAYLFIIPSLWASADIGDTLLMWLQQFFFFVALTLPFDIRDAKVDAFSNLKTFANMLNGRQLSLFVGTSLMVVIICALAGIFIGLYSLTIFGMLMTTYLFLGFLVWPTARVASEMFYLGVLDGFILLIGGIYCLIPILS